MDIVERLRTVVSVGTGVVTPLRREAADEIERLREALQNVIEATAIKGEEGHASIVVLAKSLLKMESIARSALQQKDNE